MTGLSLPLLVAGGLAALVVGWRSRTLTGATEEHLARRRRPPGEGDISALAGEAAISPGESPLEVSVVVPARNEEVSLPRLLESLAAQAHPAAEVVVVDDGSTDLTASLAEAVGARVVPAGELAEGWAGKPWACARGVEAARYEHLVLLDADTWLAPDALALLLAAQDALAPGGLLSVQPRHHVERPYEQLSLFANVVPLLASGTWLPTRPEAPTGTGAVGAPASATSGRADGPSRPRGGRVVAFGPCLVTTGEALAAAGGFEAVAGEVLEDAALARAYARAGRPVVTLTGGDAVGFRMYPEGAGQLVEGWTKNLAGGAARAPLGPTVAAALWVTALAALSVEALLRPALWLLPAWTVAAAQVWWLARRAGTFSPWAAVLFPIPLWAFVGLCVRSAWHRLVKRRVAWRGRTIATGRRR